MALNIADLAISSPAFGDLEPMPERYTQYGDGLQPPLTIQGVPPGTVELAIICHDPDAPLPWGFTHWTLYNIPAETTQIGEQDGDRAFRPGPTDTGTTGYVGPRPPAGHGRHHYYFWVYALDRALTGTPTRREFLETYGDAIIEQNRTVGTYQKD